MGTGRSIGRACIGALGAAALAGCLLTTSLDGLGDGSPPITPEGGSADAPSTDAPLTEGSPLLDAGRFCESTPPTLFLCADFDEGVFPSPFELATKGAGSAVAATGDVRSAPFAALLTAPSSDATVSTALRHALPTVAADGTVVLELDLRLEQRGQGTNYDVVIISGGTSELGFQINSDGTVSFDENSPAVNAETATGRSFPSGWAHVKWMLEVHGATVSTQLFVDGASFGTKTFSSAALLDSKPLLYVGDTGQNPVKLEWRLRVDDVTIDMR